MTKTPAQLGIEAAKTDDRRRQKNKPIAPLPPPVIKTPAVMAAEAMEAIIHGCEWSIKRGAVKIEEFKERLDKNPASAFEWSATYFGDAARFDVAHMVKRYLEAAKDKADDYETKSDLEIIKTLRTIFYEEVLRKAKWPSRSTSPQSNDMELHLTSQKAEWLEVFDNHIARIERSN